MKHQQVVVDYWNMLKTSGVYLLLAFSVYLLLKMIQTIFMLPTHLNKNQKRLEELAKKYAEELDPDDREKFERMIKNGEEFVKEKIDADNNDEKLEPKKDI